MNIIPSFFGRLYAINSSFAEMARRIGEEGKRAERGESYIHRDVNDTLDLLEMLFLYGHSSDLLVEHYAFQPVGEWGKMMEKDLSVDELLVSHARDWILFSWKGKLIGGTSPYTLVYTVPGISGETVSLTDEQGRSLFDGKTVPLTKRSLRFQQYLVGLNRNYTLAPAMQSYLAEIEKLLTHDPVIRKESFLDLPVFPDVPDLVVNGVPLKYDPNFVPKAKTSNKPKKQGEDHSNEQKTKRIFVSYKRKDKEPVFKLIKKIEDEIGEKCWIDWDGIQSDAQFAEVIIKAIDTTDIFLFMYSHTHTTITNFEKDWTIRELTYAQNSNKRIVFVNIDGTEIISYLSFMFPNKQQVDATSSEALQKLLVDLRGWLK